MSQINNDAFSWGQESSETNEDNSASTDPIDWDDNSWGTSWDNNEIIHTEQPSVETFNNEKVEQRGNNNYATLQLQMKGQISNINSYDQNTVHYRQQTQIMENHNYNEQDNIAQYEDQYPCHNQQQHFVDHSNDNFNYTQQIASPPLLTLNNSYHNGQSYNSQPSSYIEHTDQNHPSQYNNSVLPNSESYQNNNLAQVQYNQNIWFNPANQMQTSISCSEQDQPAYSYQVQSDVNSNGENNTFPNLPVSSDTELVLSGISLPLHEGHSGPAKFNEENNEIATNSQVDTINEPTPRISFGRTSINSWYQDSENSPVDSTGHEQNPNRLISTHRESHIDKSCNAGSSKNRFENEDQLVHHNSADYTNQVKSETPNKINNKAIRVEKTENSCVIQHEIIDENTNIMYSSNHLEENNLTHKMDETISDINQSCEVNQNHIASYNVVEENITPSKIENDVNKEEKSTFVLREEDVGPSAHNRNGTASPYNNLFENNISSHVNMENKPRILPLGSVNKIEPNNNIMVHNHSNEEDKPIIVTDRLKVDPKKYMHLNFKKKDDSDTNVEEINTLSLSEDRVAAEKLSKLKRSTEKTTKDRNQYLETGELQDSRSMSDDTDDNADEAPSFVRMIPGSEMSDPNVTQPNLSSRQTNTSDSGNKATDSLPTAKKHTKSKRHTPRTPSPDSDSVDEDEELKVDDKKLMKIIKTIMSEEKTKKTRAKKSGKDNLESTALRIAKLLKAQKQGASQLEDSDGEHNSSLDRKPPLPTSKSTPRLTDFEKYMNSLSRRERSAKPSLSTSSPIPLEERLSSMRIQDKRTSPSSAYQERPYPQRTPPVQTRTYSERSMKSPLTDISSLDRRHTRKSSGDSFSAYGPFLAGILANFSSITKEQIASMKRLSLDFPMEYTAWYKGSYLPTWKRYKEKLNERTTIIRNRMTKQFGKYCVGKFRLHSLMKFEGSNIHRYNIDVQKLFHCYDDSNCLHELELLTPFTFDNEDKKCFTGFIQSMIHQATSLSEQLLYQLIELMFRAKGEVELSDIAELLLRSYSKDKGHEFLRYPGTALWKPRSTEEEKLKLRQHAVNNQRQKACHLALQTKDWALATLLSSDPNSHFARSELHEAFLANLPANDPLRPCFQIMFNQSVQLNSSTLVDLNEWGIHLAGILNNSTPDTVDSAAILKLGHLLGNKGDYYGEQFCTLTMNAPWTRFKLLGANCHDNAENMSLDATVTGRNLLLSMAYENAAKLRCINSPGYQFEQLQYMKYYFALKLLRLGKSKMSVHFLHHAAEEILAHLGVFCTPKHLSLLVKIVDIAGVCAGSQAQDLLWYNQLQHVLSQHIPSRCLQLPPLSQPQDLNPPPSPHIESSSTQPEYAPSHGQPYGDQSGSTRQTPVSHAMGDVSTFNTIRNPMDNPSYMNPMDNPCYMNPMGNPNTLNSISKPTAMNYTGNPINPVGNLHSINPIEPKSSGNDPRDSLNPLPTSNPMRTSAFNKPRPMPVSNPLRPNPTRSNPLGVQSDLKPLQPSGGTATKPPVSQFFTPAHIPDAESTYQQHLQDSESSTSMNQISLNSSFSYAAQDTQRNDPAGKQQFDSAGSSKSTSGGSGAGWFGFLKKNANVTPSSAQQESSPSSGNVHLKSRAPTPQQGQHPAPSYSAPPPSMMQSYPPELLPQSNVPSAFYQPQQQSYSRSSSPASSLSTEVRYYTSRRPSWSQNYR